MLQAKYNIPVIEVPMDNWRLIISSPSTGDKNMALDEAILEAVSSGESPPTLRLYAWQPPCLSIGYAQPVADVDRQRLDELGWGLVRRPTGGRAILHSDELTYAVIAANTNPHVAGGVLQSYQHLSRGLVAALTMLGLHVEVQPNIPVPEEQRTNPVCFQAPSAYEITVRGRKLVGSAQVRRRGGVLQHGSLPLKGDITRICQVLRFEGEASSQQSVQSIRERAVTVEELLGRQVPWQQAAEALIEGFTNAIGLSLDLQPPTEAEYKRAEMLVSSRYSQSSWTERI